MKPANPQSSRASRIIVRGKPVRYQVHARADGGATPVLLVHGIGCSSRAFRPTLDLLADRGEPRRVFAPDMPGYGSTPGPRRAMDMEALGAWQLDFLDALGIPRVHVIGNSMGCQVAMAMARQAPARVASLVLTGPTTGDQFQPLWRYMTGLVADSLFESWAYNISLTQTFLQMGVLRYIATMRHLLRDHPIARAHEVERGLHRRITEVSLLLREAHGDRGSSRSFSSSSRGGSLPYFFSAFSRSAFAPASDASRRSSAALRT